MFRFNNSEKINIISIKCVAALFFNRDFQIFFEIANIELIETTLEQIDFSFVNFIHAIIDDHNNERICQIFLHNEIFQFKR